MFTQKLTINSVITINRNYKLLLTGLSYLAAITTAWSQTFDVAENKTAQKTVEAQTLHNFRFFTALDSVLFTPAQLDLNKPILLFYFSTKCPYCQDLTKEITQYIDSLKSIQILMVSGHRRQSIAKYADLFSLKNFPITILKDDEKRMHEYFDYSAVPMLRLYDKNRRLIYRQEGKLSVKEILNLFRQHI
jgi:thiol-disulfide isomerase/thioredoxin